MLEAKAKDTSACALQKKKVLTKIFQAISTKKRFPKKFSSALQNFNNSKMYCCLRAEDGPIFEDLRSRGQGQGLDLRGQGQDQSLQNVSSRTSSRPRTSSRTPPLTRSSERNFIRVQKLLLSSFAKTKAGNRGKNNSFLFG